MGFVMPHITILIGAGAVGLALIFQIVGVATPGWIVGKTVVLGRIVEAELGLWSICAGGICNDYGATAAWLDACRAFGILGVLAMAAALVFALLICFMSERKNIFCLAAPAAAAAGAFCAMIEFAVFVGENSGASDHLGYSFALTVVACVLCVVAAVLFFLGRSRNQ